MTSSPPTRRLEPAVLSTVFAQHIRDSLVEHDVCFLCVMELKTHVQRYFDELRPLDRHLHDVLVLRGETVLWQSILQGRPRCGVVTRVASALQIVQ